MAPGGSIQAAINALPVGGGTIQLGTGNYNAAFSLDGRVAVMIQGVGGRTAGGGSATQLQSSVSANSPVITAGGSFFCTIRDVKIDVVGAGFTGSIIDLSTGGQCTGFTLENFILQGARGVAQTSKLINLNRSVFVNIRNGELLKGGVGIYGIPAPTDGTNFANIVNVENVNFRLQAISGIKNAGAAWRFVSCNSQGKLYSDGIGMHPGLYTHDPGVVGFGLTFDNCAGYDVTTTGIPGAWITFAGQGLVIVGGRYDGRVVSPGITVVKFDENGVEGFVIQGVCGKNATHILDFGTTTGHKGAFFANYFLNPPTGYALLAGTIPTSFGIYPSAATPATAPLAIWFGANTTRANP